MKALREHCGWLDIFQGSLKTLVADLSNLYGELSSAVHSTSSRTLMLRSTLEDINLSLEHGKAVSSDLLKVLKACLALCIFRSERLTWGCTLMCKIFLLRPLASVRKRCWHVFQMVSLGRLNGLIFLNRRSWVKLVSCPVFLPAWWQMRNIGPSSVLMVSIVYLSCTGPAASRQRSHNPAMRTGTPEARVKLVAAADRDRQSGSKRPLPGWRSAAPSARCRR